MTRRCRHAKRYHVTISLGCLDEGVIDTLTWCKSCGAIILYESTVGIPSRPSRWSYPDGGAR